MYMKKLKLLLVVMTLSATSLQAKQVNVDKAKDIAYSLYKQERWQKQRATPRIRRASRH